LSAKRDLIKLLKKTGPLVAPSANPEGSKPAKIIKEARKYFGNKIDFYVNQGKLDSLPSTLVVIKNGRIIIKRQGDVRIG
jgi:L-threonylcarbamoyladenylate synthase